MRVVVALGLMALWGCSFLSVDGLSSDAAFSLDGGLRIDGGTVTCGGQECAGVCCSGLRNEFVTCEAGPNECDLIRQTIVRCDDTRDCVSGICCHVPGRQIADCQVDCNPGRELCRGDCRGQACTAESKPLPTSFTACPP